MWSLTEQSLSISNSILRKEIQIYIGQLTAPHTWGKKKKEEIKRPFRKQNTKKNSSQKIKMKVKLVIQSCPTLCDFMDCSPPGSSGYGILQARILEWEAILQ